jgi:hypothetical protein
MAMTAKKTADKDADKTAAPAPAVVAADGAPVPASGGIGELAPGQTDPALSTETETATVTTEDGDKATLEVPKAPGAAAAVAERAKIDLRQRGVVPQPETVNGKSVIGKKLNDAGTEWVDDPDYVAPSGAVSTFYDRIGLAFTNEAQRLVVEELARHLGIDDDADAELQTLPEGMSSVKSVASQRQDLNKLG